MRLWKKRTAKTDLTVNATAEKIAAVIIRLQSMMAASLQKFEMRYTVRQKKIMLLCFCAVCAFYLLYVFSDAVFSGTAK